MGATDWRTKVGNLLPPRIAVPLRHRFGPSREAEMGLVRRVVPAGGTCVDVGANKGTWTYGMAKAVGATGRVVALEPQPELALYLEQAFSGMGQVEVHEVAASDCVGTSTLSIPLDRGVKVPGHASLSREHEGSVQYGVRLVPLDDLVGEQDVSFVKIDVEGHEWSVIAGAAGLLHRSWPTLVVELTDVEPESGSARTFTYLTSLGYTAGVLTDGVLVPISEWPYWNLASGHAISPNVVFQRR